MADRLDSMVIRVGSPDQKITATLARRDHVDLQFSSGAYRQYDERGLEHQLARLATVVWVEYRRGYFQALSEATGETVRSDDREYEPRRRRFQEARAETPAEGVSAAGWVRAETLGMARWRVTIRDGALRQLTEEQFVGEARDAVSRLLLDYYAKMVSLKDEFFDLKLPAGNNR